jgi:cell division protein ZapA (FtsZ GTPase activity inhibitor)
VDSGFHIKLQIAGRFYPLIIDRKDEEKVRKAARVINEKFSQYQQRYRDKDGQDFLAMAAFQFVLKLIELEEKTNDAPLITAIEEITEELEEFIQKID